MLINDRAACFIFSIVLLLILCPSGAAKIIYVDDDAAGANNGTSWDNAYTFLQEALADARLAEKPVEIRVAQGIYRPNEGLVAIPEFDWRTTTFQLINGVTLKGGYAGLTTPDPNARDVGLYETILSGDLNGDDGPNFTNNLENSYHVVTGSRTDGTAVLDGFTITGGKADGPSSHNWGGGMYNDSSSPTLNNCIFSNNSADSGGGGMYNNKSNPVLTTCIFTENSANLDGGGMNNNESKPTLTNCFFNANKAHYGGGGMMNFYNGSPVLNSCTFSENSAEWGGGIHNLWDCNPTLTDCTFSRNRAEGDGGGVFNEENSDPNIMNCTFRENVAHDGKGGGICNLNLSSPAIFNCAFEENSANIGGGVSTTYKSNPILADCTFTANRANGGGGMVNLWDSNPKLKNCTFSRNVAVYEGGGIDNSESSATLTNCTFVGNTAPDIGGVYNSWDGNSTLANCIVWDNTLPQITGNAFITYSDIQGGYEGEGNINADPLFVDPNNEDFHLISSAGRWDPVSGSWVVDNVTSPCIDAGDPDSPVAFEPFPNGGIVNMGAYGGTTEASKSPSGLHAKYGGGAGEPNKPYLIYTPEQMNTIGLHPEDQDSHFKLMADIDLGGLGTREFNMIGTFPNTFLGVFDGNGHTISNFTYISTDVAGVALFSYVEGAQAEIRDLGLIDTFIDVGMVNPNVNKGIGNRAGSLVDNLRLGTVSRCYVRGGSVSGDLHIGGLVAYNHKGLLTDCYSIINVAGIKDVGGLVGYNNGTVTDCHAISTVTGEDNVGGLAGSVYINGTIRDSSAMGHVTGDGYIGGLVGHSFKNSAIQGSYSTSRVTGIHYVGGLAGRSLGEISNCYSTGSISGGRYVGGLVGFFGGLIEDCYSVGYIIHEPIEGFEGDPRIGGLVGTGYLPDDSFRSFILMSFWDIETSGRTVSFGGTGLTTAEMQTAKTFIEAGWDFINETDNGTDDIWWITEGRDYPRLLWEPFD